MDARPRPDARGDAELVAFLVAAERLGQLRDPERLRPWLYAMARRQAFHRVRARSRVAPEEEMTDLPDPTTGAELGEAIGAEPGHADVLLSRLRDQVERSPARSWSPAWVVTTAPTWPRCWPAGTAASPR